MMIPKSPERENLAINFAFKPGESLSLFLSKIRKLTTSPELLYSIILLFCDRESNMPISLIEIAKLGFLPIALFSKSTRMNDFLN